MSPEEISGADAEELLQLDPDRSTLVFACGRKGSGKSHAITHLFRAYPYDRLLVDVTGDVDPHLEFTEPAPMPPPESWPEAPAGERASYRLRPNRRHAGRVNEGNYRSVPRWKVDVDEWVGLAFDHGRSAVEIDDCEDLVPHNPTPCIDQALAELRHRDLSLFLSCIRPVGINVKCIGQADWVLIFDTPHALDQRRLAENLGVDVDELHAVISALDEHEFLLWWAERRQLFHCDKLP